MKLFENDVLKAAALCAEFCEAGARADVAALAHQIVRHQRQGLTLSGDASQAGEPKNR